MDLKKINILLIPVLGVGIVLIISVISFLVLQRSLIIPKVQASPGSTCTVSDDLEITKKLLVGCIGIEGGCLDGGQNKKCSSSAKDCRCDSGQDIAEVTCPDGTYLISGGCDSDSGTVGLSHNTARGDPPNRWYCNWRSGVGWERAKAVCCRIKVDWDPTLRTVSD